MEKLRKPFQGVANIIRFNWHFYVLALFSLAFLVSVKFLIPPLQVYVKIFFWLVVISITLSLLASYYIYDISDLYKFKWVSHLNPLKKGTILNIHAGFDETSDLIKKNFALAEIIRLDFYDVQKHTEVSIKRARKAFPNPLSTINIQTDQLPQKTNTVDLVLLILAAHEIRNTGERIVFFKEIRRTLKPNGQIAVIEHLRDFPNFLAYTFGFVHFFSKQSWKNCFSSAGLTISREVKITPFLSLFLLENGNTY